MTEQMHQFYSTKLLRSLAFVTKTRLTEMKPWKAQQNGSKYGDEQQGKVGKECKGSFRM